MTLNPEQAMRKRIEALIEPKTCGLDTPVKPAPARSGPFVQQVSFGPANGRAAPVRFPTRRRGPAVMRFIAASDFLMGCSLVALGVVLLVSGLVMLLWRSI